jgi:hypothetical protein
MLRQARTLWAHAAGVGAAALSMPWLGTATRTGGPDDDDEDEVRGLIPVLVVVILLAIVFG